MQNIFWAHYYKLIPNLDLPSFFTLSSYEPDTIAASISLHSR